MCIRFFASDYISLDVTDLVHCNLGFSWKRCCTRRSTNVFDFHTVLTSGCWKVTSMSMEEISWEMQLHFMFLLLHQLVTKKQIWNSFLVIFVVFSIKLIKKTVILCKTLFHPILISLLRFMPTTQLRNLMRRAWWYITWTVQGGL